MFLKLGCGAEKLEADVDFQAEGLDDDDAISYFFLSRTSGSAM